MEISALKDLTDQYSEAPKSVSVLLQPPQRICPVSLTLQGLWKCEMGSSSVLNTARFGGVYEGRRPWADLLPGVLWDDVAGPGTSYLVRFGAVPTGPDVRDSQCATMNVIASNSATPSV